MAVDAKLERSKDGPGQNNIPLPLAGDNKN